MVDSCVGGLYDHRYRTGSGFANPSVCCADLDKIITHMRADDSALILRLPMPVLINWLPCIHRNAVPILSGSSLLECSSATSSSGRSCSLPAC